VDPAKAAESGEDVAPSGHSWKPRIGGRIVRDEEQGIGRIGECGRHAIDYPHPPDALEPLRIPSVPRREAAGEDHADAA
jgi:hypothetical protein